MYETKEPEEIQLIGSLPKLQAALKLISEPNAAGIKMLYKPQHQLIKHCQVATNTLTNQRQAIKDVQALMKAMESDDTQHKWSIIQGVNFILTGDPFEDSHIPYTWRTPDCYIPPAGDIPNSCTTNSR